MTEVKFQWENFKMENSAKDFFEKYISRIDKYAKNHKIDDDVLDDIHQSILEKLFEIKWEITQKKLVPIVNSIWEPEDIFDIEDVNIDVSPKKEKSEPKYKPRILWVCAWLAELMRIPVWIVRLVFFFLIFAYSFGIWLYLTAFLIRFVTDKENAIIWTSDGSKRIATRLWDWVRWIWKSTGSILKWIWRLFVCGVLLFCIWLMCAWIWLLISDLTVQSNQSLKMMVNPIRLIPLWLLILAFAFWFIAWIFRLRWNPIKNWFAHFLALIVAIVGCVWIWAEWIWFIWMHRYTYNIPIDLWEIPASWFISMETMGNIDASKPRIYYELHEGNELKAEFEYEFSAKNDEVAKEIRKKANMPTVSKNEKWRVIGWWENNNLYNEIVPYNSPTILVNITLPAWYQLDLNRALSNRCPYGKYVYFDEEKQNFLCEWEKSSIDKYNIAKEYLKENADEIAPLKWLHPSWSQTNNEQYRSLDSINFTDENKLLAKLSDQFFNFFMIIEYAIDEDTWEFTLLNSMLKNIEQKWVMDIEKIKYYEWWENLTGFNIQMDEEEE